MVQLCFMAISMHSKNGADYIFQTDSDGQTLPEEFEPFWKRRQKYDMVIGWRKAGRMEYHVFL